MNFEIRAARAGDMTALAELERRQPSAAGWGFGGLNAELQKPESLLLVAVSLYEEHGDCGGMVCGFCCAAVLPPEAQILNLAVSPDYARAGIASALLREVFNKAAERGCTLATLEVNETNLPAIALYKKLGFEVVGRRPKFYNGCDAALLMDCAV